MAKNLTLATTLLFLSSFSSVAFAQDDKKPTPQPTPTPTAQKETEPLSKIWEFGLMGGPTLSPRTTYFVKLPNSRDSWRVNDRPSYYVAAELLHLYREHIGFGGQVLWSEYKYDDGRTSDKHVGLLGAARIHHTFENNIRVWAGIALGLLYTKVGQNPTIDGSASASANHSNLFGWAFIPRLGADYLIGPFTAGLEASIFGGTFMNSGTDTDLTTGSTVTYDKSASRAWYALAGRLGFQF